MAFRALVAAVILAGLGAPAAALGPEDLDVYRTRDAVLVGAVDLANRVLSNGTRYEIGLGVAGDRPAAVDDGAAILAFTVRPRSEAGRGLFVIPGYRAIYFEKIAFGDRLSELTSFDAAFVDAVDRAVQRTDQIPDGFLGEDGTPGKNFTRMGLDLMRRTELRQEVLLAAFLLHEVGHIHHRHPIADPERSVKELEREADQYAADLIAGAMLDDQSIQETKSTAYLMFHHMVMVGFKHTGRRMLASAALLEPQDDDAEGRLLPVVDRSDTHENWELRIKRILALTAERAVPGSALSRQVEDALDQILLERGDVSPGQLMAKGLLRDFEDMLKRERQAADIAARLRDPGLLRYDPERVVLLIYEAQFRYSASDYVAARERLAEALDIVTKLRTRAGERGLQVLGPLAVLEIMLGNVETGRGYCDEALPLLDVHTHAPAGFSTHLRAQCRAASAE